LMIIEAMQTNVEDEKEDVITIPIEEELVN
jgi:hypothetical protein